MFVATAKRRGFTIIELMIATAVFSVVLMLVTAGVLTFSRQYIKGQTANQVQTSTVAALNQVSQDVQFSNSFDDSEAGNIIGCYQIGNDLYAYDLGATVSSSQHALVMAPISATSPSCLRGGGPITPAGLITVPGARELLATNMRLFAFSVTQGSPPAQQVLNVVLRTGAGADDLLRKKDGTTIPTVGMSVDDWSGVHCAGGAGNQYCMTMQLTTNVAQRL